MSKTKAMNIRLPLEVWEYLKMLSMRREKSMNRIIIDSLLNIPRNPQTKSLTESPKVVP